MSGIQAKTTFNIVEPCWSYDRDKVGNSEQKNYNSYLVLLLAAMWKVKYSDFHNLNGLLGNTILLLHWVECQPVLVQHQHRPRSMFCTNLSISKTNISADQLCIKYER